MVKLLQKMYDIQFKHKHANVSVGTSYLGSTVWAEWTRPMAH